MLYAHAALLDVENRLLLCRSADAADDPWDLPGCPVDGAPPDAALIAHLLTMWRVETKITALFPLTFCTRSDGPDANDTARAGAHRAETHLVWGCRNWVGPHGLLAASHASHETAWVRPSRLLDRPVTAACRRIAPNLLTLIG